MAFFTLRPSRVQAFRRKQRDRLQTTLDRAIPSRKGAALFRGRRSNARQGRALESGTYARPPPKAGSTNQEIAFFLWHHCCVTVLPLSSRRPFARKMSNTSAPAIRTRLDAVHGCRAEDVRGCLWYNHEEGETKEGDPEQERGGRQYLGASVLRGCEWAHRLPLLALIPCSGEVCPAHATFCLLCCVVFHGTRQSQCSYHIGQAK